MEYEGTNIKLDHANGQIISANCTLNSGFEYAFNLMTRGGILTVIDARRAETDPVAVICNYTPDSLLDIENAVERVIRLYKSHQIISIAHNIEEFDKTFSKVA